MHKWILPRDYFRSEIVPSLGRLFLEKLAIFSEKPAIFVEVDNFPATKPAIFAEKSCDFWEKTSGHPGRNFAANCKCPQPWCSNYMKYHYTTVGGFTVV